MIRMRTGSTSSKMNIDLGNPHFMKKPGLSIRKFSHSNFSISMATGIVSISCHAMGFHAIASILFCLNIGIFAALCVMELLRMVLFGRQFFGEMTDHRRGPGFFTIIAASCVLGNQLVLIAHDFEAALAFWFIGIALWALSTYAIFTAFIVKPVKPALDAGINGAWLLAVVAPQSIAALGALLSAHFRKYSTEFDFLALSMWLFGGMIYIWLISQIFYRFTFLRFMPDDLESTYWINMGAMAISTLTGSLLIVNARGIPLLEGLLPFLEGFTLFFWAAGTWWIPMLVVLEIWQHVYKRVPIAYDPMFWSTVFPLGMYAAGTFQMARALDLGFLDPVARGFLFVSLTAWFVAFAGLARLVLSGFAPWRKSEPR